MEVMIKKLRFYPFRTILRCTAAYAIGAAAVFLLYLTVAINVGFRKEGTGVVFLLIMGAFGAFIGGFLLKSFLKKDIMATGNGKIILAAKSALVEFSVISIGAISLFFVMNAEAEGFELQEFVAFSAIGLLGITLLNAIHGAVIAGDLFPEKHRCIFALASGGTALAFGLLLGLPYLWVMSGLPMIYRGIEYQMLVPVLITVLSIGATTGFCMAIYYKWIDRSQR